LTALRTPAVSVAAVRGLLRSPLRLVVFGAGPQGTGHIATLAALFDLASVDVVVRTPRAADLAEPVPAGPRIRVLAAGSREVAVALRQADVVVCATTAREPLFDSALLPDRAVVVAIGSHEPDAREVDAA